MNLRKTAALLVGAMFVLGACNAATPSGSGGGGSLDGALVPKSAIKIEVVTHGQAIDGFWGVVRNGVKAGAADMGVTVNYSAPDAESDMVKMSQLDRRGRGQEAAGPRRLDPERRGAVALDQEGDRGRYPGRLDELGFRRLPRPRHQGPRRPDRVPGRPRRR